MRVVRLGCVGFEDGYNGGVFRSNPRAELYALAEQNPSLRKEAAERLGIERVYEDYRDVLRLPEVDAICVGTPTSEKPQVAVEAAGAGKHIWMPKAIGTGLEKVMELERAVRRAGVKFTCHLTERFNPLYLTAHKAISEGEIGSVEKVYCLRQVKFVSERRPTWMLDAEKYAGVGELAVHDVDIVRWTTGKEFKEVRAHLHGEKFPHLKGFTDSILIFARLSGGTSAFVDVNWLNPHAAPYHGDIRFQAVGAKGFVELSYREPYARVGEGAIEICTDEEGPRAPELVEEPLTLQDDFLLSILGDREPRVTLSDAVEAMKVIFAAKRSHDSSEPVLL